MIEGEKVVARFRDGTMLKGYIKDFSVDSETVALNDQQTKEERLVPINELKAIFFVKSFTGASEHVEKKAFGIRKLAGRKAYVKFSDTETLIGFIEGDVPWDKGYALANLGEKAKGFFLTPVDGDSNNDKIFVVGSAVKDVAIIG